MNRTHKANKIILYSIFPLLVMSCSGPNSRIDIASSDALKAIENMNEISNISCLYLNYQENDYLEVSHCNQGKDGYYSVGLHEKEYLNDINSTSIYVEYKGNSKEGFLRKCIELDPPKSMFGYNDFLPIFKKLAQKAESFYRYSDSPSSTYRFTVDKKNEFYDSFISFLEGNASKKQCDLFSNSENIEMITDLHSANSGFISLMTNISSNDGYYLSMTSN